VSRLWLLAAAIAGGIFAQEQKAQEPKPEEPPEEDADLKPKEYSFNPLQAEKEVKIGDFYLKKGSWRAAAKRYQEATKWSPGYAEAWLRLGDAQEKLKDSKAARESYAKYIELAPDTKQAASLKKKLGKRN